MTTKNSALRSVTADEIECFWTDGVVVLREILDPAIVIAMAQPVDELLGTPTMANLSAMADALAVGSSAGGMNDPAGTEATTANDPEAQRGTFASGVDHWRTHHAFRAFACDSPLPAIAGALLKSNTVRLWEDSVLVKEPGTQERTAWHQDLGYFHADGTQICTSWCPLDVVDGASGAMSFVRGSHRGELYQPNFFVSKTPIPGMLGAAVPNISALAEQGVLDIISFNLQPGDVSFHHARTLHGAGPNNTDRRRRAISVRYCGDDVRYVLRPGAPQKSHHALVRNGDPLDGPDCPLVWTRDQ